MEQGNQMPTKRDNSCAIPLSDDTDFSNSDDKSSSSDSSSNSKIKTLFSTGKIS